MAVKEAPVVHANGHGERRNYARIPTIIDLPNLIEVQQKSYARFLQQDRPPLDREDSGLQAVFRSVFPIQDFNGTASLEYVGYEIGMWETEEGEYKGLGGASVVHERSQRPLLYRTKYEVAECRQKGITYADPLRVMVRLVVRDFPLSQHADAPKAAEAAEAAREQGKYWEYVTVLFRNQSALGIDKLRQYATDLGLDRARFDASLDSGKRGWA